MRNPYECETAREKAEALPHCINRVLELETTLEKLELVAKAARAVIRTYPMSTLKYDPVRSLKDALAAVDGDGQKEE